MNALARWLRSLADTIDPQVPPMRLSGGLSDTEYREHMCQWMRDNGLDPNDIPEDSEFVVENGTLTVDVVVRDNAGAIMVDGNSVKRTKKTVPLLVPYTTRSASA